MRATLIVLLVAMSMMSLGNLINPQAQGSNIIVETNRFNTGSTEAVVEFLGGGIDSNYGLSVQTGMYIDEVKMKVSSVAQPAGSRDYPSNIQLDVGGDRSLEWAWQGMGYGPLGRQTMFVNNLPTMNASFPAGGGYNDSVALRLPKSAVVKSATLNVSTGMRPGSPGNLMLVYSDGWYSDLYNKLRSYSSDFPTVRTYNAQSNTPTWDDIKDSYYIVVWCNYYNGYQFRSPTDLGNLMADYVDAGGSLVLTSWDFCGYDSSYLGGRFEDEGYYVIQPSQGYGNYGSPTLGEIAIANHPVMTGVNSLSLGGYYWWWYPYYGYWADGYYPSASEPTEGGQVISYWSSGSVLAAQKNVNGVDRVDLGVYPISYSYSNYPWPGTYTGNCDRMVRNALLYGGRKPISFSVDLLNDSSIEVSRTNFLGNYTFPDFSAYLNSYLASAPVSFTDKFGNKFVDIPINASTLSSGRLSFGGLAVTYDYSTAVDVNPVTGNLTMGVSEAQPTVLGEHNNTIPFFISSSSSGKLLLSDLYVRMSPPVHKPRVDSFYPPLETSVPEASTLDFRVNATDIYRNPMSFTWFRDDERLPGTTSSRQSIDYGFEDAGVHTVMVKISNGISEKTFTTLNWQITVTDVNRPPETQSFSPAGDVTLDEGESQLFELTATDPDAGDTLAYSWFLDNKQVAGATGINYTFAPGYHESGLHTIKAVVTDRAGATDFKVWQATVLDINMAPLIQAWSPKQDPRIMETESVEFNVTAFDPDPDDRVAVNWFVDDALVFTGTPFVYQSDYKSAGVHVVKAVASDGEGTGSRSWTLTVDNVNREPFPSIGSPIDQSEYKEGQSIKFSARYTTDPDNETLSFNWKEGGVNVSDQMEFERAFPPGLHTITLEVRDGSGGLASTTVRFRVRYVEIATAIGLDRFEVQAGNKVSVILTISNMGDTNATDMAVTVSVDGKSLGSTTIGDLRPGGVEKLVYEWKATRGPHTITAKVGDKTWTKQVSVAAAPPPPPSAGIGDYAWAIVLVVILVVVLGFGMMVLKKK